MMDLQKRTENQGYYLKKKFFNYPLSATEALFKLGFFESFLCGISFFKAKIFPKKNPISFHDWVANSFGERLYKNFFKTYTEKVWGMSCDEISADWAAQRIKGLNFVNLILNSIKFLNFKNNKKVIKTLIKKLKLYLFIKIEKIRIISNKIIIEKIDCEYKFKFTRT